MYHRRTMPYSCRYSLAQFGIYSIFMNSTLIFSDDIALCMRKAHTRVTVVEATRLLLFSDAKLASEFAQKVLRLRESLIIFTYDVLKKGWKLENGEYRFDTKDDDADGMKSVETTRLATQNIYYAKQLEMIV